VTSDGKWTAQCEHTMLITETGVEAGAYTNPVFSST